MAGLIAGNILRRHNCQIVERQSGLPNNHHAVLRFRTNRVSDACHIPFREVRVFKTIVGDFDPVNASLLYSRKVTGRYEVRSIKSLDPVDRYIAPPDFIAQAAASLNIAYGVDAKGYFSDLDARADGPPIISTMPMPILMDLLEYKGERPDFGHSPGWTAQLTIPNCDVFMTAYVPEMGRDLYRISITGDRLIMEFVGDMPNEAVATVMARDGIDVAASAFGLHRADLPHECQLTPARYAKLNRLSPRDQRLAKDFMYWASTHYNVYSLGRFATWRSDLLLDDVVTDVLAIERWITSGSYELRKGYDQ